MARRRERVLTEPIAFADMLRLWGWRTWLLAIQCTVQGGQYVVAPSRPVRLQTYRLLAPIGELGWEVLGVLFIVAGVTLALAKAGRIHTPGWLWAAAFSLAGSLYAFLVIATLANHGYLPSTLILPLGLCLAELDLIGRLRARRRLGERECG
jgi:hypothetical protein